ncbi:MAG: HAMP domain-containing histidine kinase [Bacteroidetes bacterium]|nr:HAMP domain-containing histidine kinase [Bacteroidota bacterium]
MIGRSILHIWFPMDWFTHINPEPGMICKIYIHPLVFLIAIPIIFLILGFLLGILVQRKGNDLKRIREAKIKLPDDSNLTKPQQKTIGNEEELRLLNATKDKFFSIIAHDLKNPFNSLLGFSDLLMNDFESYDKAEIKRFIQIIHESSKHGFNLLENLLQWSRAQTGRIAFIPENLNIKDMIMGCIDLLQPIADKKQIKIYHDLPNDMAATGDIEMLSTVFRNLISNAIKFTPTQGRIKIKARKLSQRIEISVIDTGIGIPPEKIPDLFRIDKQVSSLGTSNEKGTGLGLILCKEFIDKHKGIIKVRSERKNGSEFKVFLPLQLQKQEGYVRKQQQGNPIKAS